MSKNIFVVLSFIALTAFSPTPDTRASQAPDVFVINTSTKQCARFNSGDEYVRHELPPSWNEITVNYVNETKSGDIVSPNYAVYQVFTSVGAARVPGTLEWEKVYPTLCQKLGYRFIKLIPGITHVDTNFNTRTTSAPSTTDVASDQPLTRTQKTVILFAVSFVVAAAVTAVARRKK